MIRIRELRRTGEGENTQVHISFFITVEDQTIYQEVVVDDFDIENSTIDQVEAVIELNADEAQIMEQFTTRHKQLSNTYRHNGVTFTRPIDFKIWAVGLEFAEGTLTEFEGVMYRCRQAHTVTDPAWTPVATPALWHRIQVFSQGDPEIPEWLPGVAYALGDQVTYEGVTYQILQAHTSQAGWEPPVVPALWTEIT